VLITFTMSAYALPSLRFNPCVGNGPEWHAGRAHRAVKIGWTSVSKLTPAGAVVVVVRSGTVTVVVDVVAVVVNDDGGVKAIRHIPNAFSVAAW